MKLLNFQNWYEEYKFDLFDLFKKLKSVLKSKDMDKRLQFEKFCKLIYSKSSKYG